MTDKPDYVSELRTIARLIETKAPVSWREQDAAQLCKAVDEIERLREAVCAECAAIIELIESARADAPQRCAYSRATESMLPSTSAASSSR
jgi:hypothetical protein